MKYSILLATAASVKAAQDGKCRVLALSSGDEDAAYQAGALKGIVTSDKLQAEQYQYNAITGVSGGALNAVLLANHTIGDEAAAADRMQQFWIDASNNELYKSWVGGISRGLFFEGGLYNSAPLEDFLKKEFYDVNVQRDINMGITNMNDGSFDAFSDKNITQGGNLIDAMYASMSFAGFFPPAEVLGSAWMDGSAIWDLDIFSGVNRCIEAGFSEDQIDVDVIMTSSANLKHVQAEDYKSISMLFRYLEISSFYNSMDGLLRAQYAYKNVNFRYVISPTGEIPSSLKPLSLSEADIKAAQEMGVKDAQAAIAQGETQSIKDLTHYYALKKVGSPLIKGKTYGDFLAAKANGELPEYDIKADPYMKKYLLQ